MHTSRTSPRARAMFTVSAMAAVALMAGAGPAAAHAHVSASDARALAENVTLTFNSEAESGSAGIKELRIVLPEGIAPAAVALKEAPRGWKLTATADGYTVGGPALAVGTDAEHSITVRQLPDAPSIAFKTVETYGDGERARWIEIPQGKEKVENPAPVLELKPAAPGAKPLAPSPSPSPAVESSTASPAPATSAPAADPSPGARAETEKDSSGGGTGVIVAVVVAVAVAAAGAVWWARRQRTAQ